MILFGIYSWVQSILYHIMEYLPSGIRTCIFKLCLNKFGKNSFIDYKTYIRYPKRVSIGNNVTINRGVRLFPSYHLKDVIIEIEDNCAIGPEVCMFAAGHDYKELSLPNTAASIHIGRHVWIGGRSIILQGVNIGEGAIIAAGSIVTKDVESYSVYAGVPARKIKDRTIDK